MIADFLSWLMPQNVSLEDPRFNLNDPEAYAALGAVQSDAGLNVSPRIAMSLAPVWQSMSIIGGDVATSTANVYRRTGDDDREIASDHPANFLISTKPNEEMSAFELWRRAMNHALLWPGGYIFIDRLGGVGRPLGLYNLLPDRTWPARDNQGTLYYKTDVGGELHALKKEDVIHIKGMSIENGIGYDLVCAARNSWGLSLAAEGFGSKFFANGSQSGGIVEVPPTASDEAVDRLMQGIKKKHTGKDNWFKHMVLRDGAKFHSTTIDAEKAQLIEVRETQVRDTARFFNLPPYKLGLADSVSYNSSEQSQIQYITGCLTHWFGSLRGELQLKLLSEQELRTGSHFIDFNTSKLIERDLLTQVQVLEIERRNEIINAAEWRKKRNLPPRTDPASKEYINPNTKSADKEKQDKSADDKPESEPKKKPAPKKAEMTPAAMTVCEDAILRIARRVTAHAKNTAKNPAKFVTWLDSKAHDHRDVFHQMLLPAASLVAEFTESQADDVCYAWGGKFFASLVVLLDVATKPPHVSADLERNISEQCQLFEASICRELLSSLKSKEDHAEVSQTAA